MILAFLLITILLFAEILSKRKFTGIKAVIALLAFAAVIASLFLIRENDVNHWGMKEVSTSKTESLTPSIRKNGLYLLLYQQLGTKKAENERVYLYKTDNTQTRFKKTSLKNFKAKVEKNVRPKRFIRLQFPVIGR